VNYNVSCRVAAVFWLGRRTCYSMVASSITHRRGRGDGWLSLCG